MTPDDILHDVANYRPLQLPVHGAVCAAVLVPLRRTVDGADLEILLTRRAQHLDAHAGQVSFPGGRIDDSDADAEAAALRELHEELGVEPGTVDIIGRLDDAITVTGYHVVPVVGMVPSDVQPIPNPNEVARAFWLPFSRLLDEACWERRMHSWRGSQVGAWHLPYDGEDVWGATAFILRNLAERLWRRAREADDSEIAPPQK